MFRYRQPCAIARALDVVGERWTLLIVRELMLGSTTTAELLLGLPHLSKATLTNRLRTLAKAGIVSDDGGEHELTDEGWRLLPVLRELATWAGRRTPPHSRRSTSSSTASDGSSLSASTARSHSVQPSSRSS